MNLSWLRLTRVFRADIPEHLRVEFERLGEPVVAQVLGRPLTHAAGQTIGVPMWAASAIERELALAWLKERRCIDDRRREIGERVEIWILILVAIEAVPILAAWVVWLYDRVTGH